MGDGLYKKAVVPGIILLFIVAGCVPIIHGEIFKKEDNASPNLKTKVIPNNLDFISAYIINNIRKKDISIRITNNYTCITIRNCIR